MFNAGVSFDHAVVEDVVDGGAVDFDAAPEGVDGGEVRGREREVVRDEDGVDMRGRFDALGGHAGDEGAGGGDVHVLGGEEAVEDDGVGADVGGEAIGAHVGEEAVDELLLHFGRGGLEGVAGVADEAVEEDGEGDGVRVAGVLVHVLEETADSLVVIAADGVAQQGVEGCGVEFDGERDGPFEDLFGDVGLVVCEEAGDRSVDGHDGWGKQIQLVDNRVVLSRFV